MKSKYGTRHKLPPGMVNDTGFKGKPINYIKLKAVPETPGGKPGGVSLTRRKTKYNSNPTKQTFF